VASARRGREQRLVSRCRVEFDRPSGPVEAETEDVSARGLYIRTEALLPVGEETDLRLTLPDGTILALYARVAHMLTPTAARTLGRHAGMGFELIGPDTPARIMLRAHMETLRTEITNPGLSTTTQVIVVEPSAPMRTRMARCLEAAGFKVTAVANATEALQACTVWRPDAIVAAATMDRMTGLDLAYAMSEHSTLSDVPLVLCGDEGDLARLDAFRAGVRDYIPRPFLDEELVIRVHRIAAPSPAANPGLRGSLIDIGLGTLLSLFEFERKSGVLLLLGGGEIARIFVADGRCLKVETSATNGAVRPKDRLMRLLDWREGQFEFSPAAVGGRDEIGVTITALLLEHARRADESRPVSRQ
jgi:CheY-like chemotaxis protein